MTSRKKYMTSVHVHYRVRSLMGCQKHKINLSYNADNIDVSHTSPEQGTLELKQDAIIVK